MTPSRIPLLVAVACFVLAAFGVHVAPVDLTDIGLAFLAGAGLV